MKHWMLLSLLCGVLLAGCSPRLDWRELSDEGTGLQFMLPCKPERATRPIALPSGQSLQLRMLGCEAAGTLYAVSFVEIAQAATLAEVWAGWPQAVRSAAAAEAVQEAGVLAPHLMRADRLLQQRLQGRKPDGTPLQAELLWLARGPQLVHVALYADTLQGERRDVFWEGLRWP